MAESLLTNAPAGTSERDPTKSITLRNNYARAMRKRFQSLRGVIRKTIVENDALGLQERRAQTVVNQEAERLVYTTQEELVNRFDGWLQNAMDEEILEAEIVRGPSREVASREEWQNKYIRRAYGKGIRDADVKLRDQGLFNESLFTESVEETFNKPIHAEKLARLFSHNFEALKGAVETGAAQEAGEVMRNQITKGVAEGINPRDIADNIVSAVDEKGISILESRAENIARTEVTRAHYQASIERYREFGVDKVQSKGEIVTAGDRRVCPICLGLEGQRFPLKKAESIIPAHPMCRCTILPVVGGKEIGQRSQRMSDARQQLREEHDIDPDRFDPFQLKQFRKTRDFNRKAAGRDGLSSTFIEDGVSLDYFKQ